MGAGCVYLDAHPAFFEKRNEVRYLVADIGSVCETAITADMAICKDNVAVCIRTGILKVIGKK